MTRWLVIFLGDQRVAIAVPFRERGGVTRLVEGMVRRASAIGIDPLVLRPAGQELHPGLSTIEAPVAPLPRPGHVREVAHYVTAYPGRQAAIAKLLRSLSVDGLLTFGLNVFDVLPGCELGQIPFVLSLNSDRGRSAAGFLRLAASRASAVLVEGPGVTRNLLGGFSRTPVIPFLPPVDVPVSPPERPDADELQLGMLCNFSPQKDHDLALHALRAALRRGARVRLHLAGDRDRPNPYRAQVESLVADLGLTDAVELAGWQDAGAFLGSVDVLVVSSRFEGVATSTVEGMASGRPFISTHVGSLPDLAEASGGGLSAVSTMSRAEGAAALADLMVTAATDRAWIAAASGAGRRFVARRCTWDAWEYDLRRAFAHMWST